MGAVGRRRHEMRVGEKREEHVQNLREVALVFSVSKEDLLSC